MHAYAAFATDRPGARGIVFANADVNDELIIALHRSMPYNLFFDGRGVEQSGSSSGS